MRVVLGVVEVQKAKVEVSARPAALQSGQAVGGGQAQAGLLLGQEDGDPRHQKVLGNCSTMESSRAWSRSQS